MGAKPAVSPMDSKEEAKKRVKVIHVPSNDETNFTWEHFFVMHCGILKECNLLLLEILKDACKTLVNQEIMRLGLSLRIKNVQELVKLKVYV